jgi:hypothetical protein
MMSFDSTSSGAYAEEARIAWDRIPLLSSFSIVEEVN